MWLWEARRRIRGRKPGCNSSSQLSLRHLNYPVLWEILTARDRNEINKPFKIADQIKGKLLRSLQPYGYALWVGERATFESQFEQVNEKAKNTPEPKVNSMKPYGKRWSGRPDLNWGPLGPEAS